MKQFIGTKSVQAIPLDRRAYNMYRGWELPADENGDDEGYLVEYLDGGKANHPAHKGYISWSPKEQFDAAYHGMGDLTFGDAVLVLQSGLKVTRSSWNGKGMWLTLVPQGLADAVAFQYEALGAQPWIGMKTAQDLFVPWVATQSDVLANDWRIAG